jgi:hypothetical protein
VLKIMFIYIKMNDLEAKQKQLAKAKELALKDCVRNPDGTYIDVYPRLECIERKKRASTTVKRLEKEIQALKSKSKPKPKPVARPVSSRKSPVSSRKSTTTTKSLRGRPPMDCSKLDSKITEKKTEKGKKTMLKKCADRASHPKKPCVVKNNKCVSK